MSEHDIEQLYRRHAPMARRRAQRLLGSEQDALEVVHDVFASLIERPEQFAGRSRMTTFFYSAVTHACLNRLRDGRTRLRLLQRERPVGVDLPKASSPEVSATLRELLAGMPAELAEVTLYHHGEGLSHADIARIVDCSPRHVGNLLSRAQGWAQNQAGDA